MGEIGHLDFPPSYGIIHRFSLRSLSTIKQNKLLSISCILIYIIFIQYFSILTRLYASKTLKYNL